jgi:Tfp pilus assembly protein PilX
MQTKRTQHSKKRMSQRGFTLLLATLIASLLLLLGAAIAGLARKEVLLSSVGRDSQFAFYAADTGAECALFWDMRYNAFATSSGFTTAECDGENLGTITFPGLGIPMEFEFEPNGYCARVTVTKNNTNPSTVIVSRGYSTTCPGVETSPRTLERAVRLTY